MMTEEGKQVTKRARMEGEESVNQVQRGCTPREITVRHSTSRFREIVHAETFIDKTLFIKAFLEDDAEKIVMLAPRRFGKSTNLDIVKEFLMGNKKLFQDKRLKIWKDERKFFDDHCKENPVIYLDFQNVAGKTKGEMYESLKILLHKAFVDHRYLIKDEADGKISWTHDLLKATRVQMYQNFWMDPKSLCEWQVIHGLKILSQCLYLYHGKRVYVLIDEFNAPIMECIFRMGSKEIMSETINLVSHVIYSFLRGSHYIKRALIMACVQVDLYPNDFAYYEVLSSPNFSLYFGFTDKEVNDLFKKDKFVALKHDNVKEWYNGYEVTHDENKCAIYSPWSVINYLESSKRMNKPQIKNYWVDSRYFANLKKFFAKTAIWTLIQKLVDGEEIRIRICEKYTRKDITDLIQFLNDESDVLYGEDLFIQLLVGNGYLTYLTAESRTRIVKVPNEQMKAVLMDNLHDVELCKKK